METRCQGDPNITQTFGHICFKCGISCRSKLKLKNHFDNECGKDIEEYMHAELYFFFTFYRTEGKSLSSPLNLEGLHRTRPPPSLCFFFVFGGINF